MENLIKKVTQDLNSLSKTEREELLVQLRSEIDILDKSIVKYLSKRTVFAILIGRVKRTLNIPTYSPEREKDIANKISSYVDEPLSKEALKRIYERIIDESRSLQKQEIEGKNINLENFDSKTEEVKKKVIENDKISFNKLLNKKEIFFVAGVFLIILFILIYTFFTPNYYESEDKIRIDISKGSTLNQITDSLFVNGVIPSKFNFKIAAYIYGAEKKIKAGRFFIPNGLSYLSLLDYLLSNNYDKLKTVRIFNGMTAKQTASVLKLNAQIDSASFVDKVFDKNYVKSYNFNTENLEGYLLPGVYEIYEKSSSEEVINLLINNFNNLLHDSLIQQSKILGYSVHELITLASIVEGETNKIDEMAIVAGVYLNRLKIGMKLQADPTVQYAIGGNWKRLTYKDLTIDSPYNTYKYSGLPPGPINNPGRNAIISTFYPAKHNYLFFVSDTKGGHKFSKTYTEHLRYVNEYRKWLQQQK